MTAETMVTVDYPLAHRCALIRASDETFLSVTQVLALCSLLEFYDEP
jgi:hypothetical protein